MTLTKKLISFENLAFLIIKEDWTELILNLENNYYQWSEALHISHSHRRWNGLKGVTLWSLQSHAFTLIFFL